MFIAVVTAMAADDEQGAEDGEEDGEGDVEEVEPGVEGEQVAAGAQGVASLLREVGTAKVSTLLLIIWSIQVAFFLLSREELILLVIFKLVGLIPHIRLVFNSCSHFSTSSLGDSLQWNEANFTPRKQMICYKSDFLSLVNGFLFV